MKTTITASQLEMDKDERKNLLTEVKETVAKEANLSAKQSFGQVDIWNIRRSMKSASTRWNK